MRAWLALLGTLPLLAVGSGAVAGTSTVLHNGLIAIQGSDGIYVVEPDSSTARLLPKTTDMGEPAWSPDGRLLAVELWDDVDSSVYTMKPDGSDRQLVLHNASAPSWSPDGERLVVVRNSCLAPYHCADDIEGSILVTVQVDGSDPEQLGAKGASDLQDAAQPAWSPDGKWIAFAAADGGIKLVSADGKADAIRSVADDGFNASWSPDSSMLAFDRLAPRADTERQVVVVIDLKTGRETTLPGRQAGAASPVWSPDGKWLAFVSSTPAAVQTGACGGHFDTHLWLTTPDGTKAYRLVEANVFGTPTWAPALETQAKPSDKPLAPQRSDAAGPRTESRPPLVAPTAADRPRPVSPVRSSAPRREARPLSSENGLIAARAPGGIYLIDPARGNVRKVPGTAEMDKPTWSPDGRLLAVEQAGGGDSTSVHTIRPDGSHLQLVVKDASLLGWSADGQRLFVVRGGCAAPDGCESVVDDSELLSVRPDGSDVREVEPEDVDVSEAGWPADGSWIAFFENVSPDDGSIPTSFDSSMATLSPDGTKLAFVSSSGVLDQGEGSAADGKTGLWVIDAEWGKPRFVAGGGYQSPSWGPATQPKPSD